MGMPEAGSKTVSPRVQPSGWVSRLGGRCLAAGAWGPPPALGALRQRLGKHLPEGNRSTQSSRGRRGSAEISQR